MQFIPDEPSEASEATEQVYGFELQPLPEGRIPTGVLVIVRHVGEESPAPGLSFRASDGIATWEAIAMFGEALRDAVEENEMWQYVSPDDDEDED